MRSLNPHPLFPMIECLRGAVIAIVVLLLVQTFFVEGLLTPHVVSSCSMSPALRGPHVALRCPECQTAFCIETGHLPQTSPDDLPLSWATCPACAFAQVPVFHDSFRKGDRIFVHRAIPSLRPIRRWETILFRTPDDGKLTVKRAVGLPGETLEIRDGDIYIDGKIAAKPFAVQNEMRISVPHGRWEMQAAEESGLYELAYHPIRNVPHTKPLFEFEANFNEEVSSNPISANVENKKWQPGTQRSGVTGESGWKNRNAWIHEPMSESRNKRACASIPPTPVTPFVTLTAFPAAIGDLKPLSEGKIDAEELPRHSLYGVTNQLCENQWRGQDADNIFPVDDLMLTFDWRPENAMPLSISLRDDTEECVQIDFDLNQQTLIVIAGTTAWKNLSSFVNNGPHKIEISLFDRLLRVTIDDSIVFEQPLDKNTVTTFALCLPGNKMLSQHEQEAAIKRQIENLRVWRDVYYTQKPDGFPNASSAFAVTIPKDCYFLLGDNSCLSVDSRSWQNTFVTQRDIIGLATVNCE